MAERNGVTEKLKAEQPMEWVGKMSALREAAAEIMNAEVFLRNQRHDKIRTMKRITLSNAKLSSKAQNTLSLKVYAFRNGLQSGFFIL